MYGHRILLIYVKLSITEKKVKTEKKGSSIFCLNGSQLPKLSQTELKSKGIPPGLSYAWQGPIFCCFP